MIEKSRPVLVLAPDEPRNARALVIVAPLTSQIRGRRGEVYLGMQGLASFDDSKLVRRMGTLTREQMADLKTALRDLLGL